MTTTNTLGSGAERRNKSTVLFGGNTSSSTTNTLTLLTNVTPQKFAPSARASNYNGYGFLFTGSAVTIGAVIDQSSSTGFVRITKSSHGLTVGTPIRVEGTDISAYNCIQIVTAVLSSSTFQTDIRYTTDAGVAGTYKLLARNFNKVVAREYIGTIIGTKIAGTADNTLLFGGAYGKLPYNTSTGDYRYNIISINAVTGVATLGASAGLLNKYHNISANNQNLVSEPLPTRAIPGRLVYQIGSGTPKQGSYNAKTE